MKLNPEKIEALAGCLRVCFHVQEFGVGDILRRFAPLPMKEPKNSALKRAVRALLGGRFTKPRLGNLLNQDIMREGTTWRGERWSLEARHDAGAEAWRYRIVDRTPEIKAEGRRLLAAVTHDAIERQLAFEDKLDAMPMVKAFQTAEREVEKRERTKKREAEREAEQALKYENRELDKLAREHDRTRQEYVKIAGDNKLFSNPISHARGEEIQQRITAYRAETERLRATADYARIVAEIKRTHTIVGGARHEVTDEMVMRIRDIEAKRKGRPWLAGMSIDPDDYGVVMSAELGRSFDTESTLRNSFQPARINWNPFKC